MTKDDLIKKRVSAISLGCDKNRVDLETILFSLKDYGFTITNDIYDSEIIIVNTCSFIQPAVKEAIDNILLAVKQKQNKCEKVIVTGCLNERYLAEASQEFPEVDYFLRIKDYSKIIDVIEELYGLDSTNYRCDLGRLQTTPLHYAFLKIADGCDNGCAYCTIPRIRGRYKSVPIETLIKQAKNLVKSGVKELIIVAQDVTRYGEDLYGENKLVELLEKLCGIKDLKWIRLHYLYPEKITKELLDFIKTHDKMAKYLDIPFQHIDEKILLDMNRRSNENDIRTLVKLIKTEYPSFIIRTTFIIGFPGETKAQFKKLCEFIKEYKLDNVGFFTYSREDKTKAYYMKKQIPEFIKRLRLKKIQKIQEKISDELNLLKVNKVETVVIDRYDETTGKFLARTQNNSPEVDFYIILDTQDLQIGKFYDVKITDYINHTFYGEIINEFTK